MNNKFKRFIQNFSYVVISNLISLCISTLVVLIVPKLIGVENYGYWQIYLFYSSYVGFMQFGWNDGIYLRYGGKEYEHLDKKLFFSQFWMLVLFQLVLASLIALLSGTFISDKNRQFILMMISIQIVIVGVRAMPILILQATNRIKEYSQIIIIDRVIYFFLICICMIIGVNDYKPMIISSIFGNLISLLLSMYYCRNFIFQSIFDFYFNFSEAFENIRVGLKLMLSSIAGMLIIGVIKFGIERTWDVSTFGKVSLTLSISNFMMLFINAIGIIMYPTLKRTNEKDLPKIYGSIRDGLMVVLLGALIVYYPLNSILTVWLPKYTESLKYMALIFPMCVYEGKMTLLISTYLKTLRKEKLMLKVNIIVLSMSIIVTFITTQLLRNLNIAVLSIIIILAIRSIILELYLSKVLGIHIFKDIVLELLMTLTFIMTAWFINSWIAVLIYVGAYIVYLIIKLKAIKSLLKSIKHGLVVDTKV